MTAIRAVLMRDLRLAWRSPQESLTVIGFFVLAALLFPFGVGPEPQLLARIASGVIWTMLPSPISLHTTMVRVVSIRWSRRRR